MPCDKTALMDFLEAINDELSKKITLVAAGGTAMTLLDLKTSTIDIDFTIPSTDRLEFEQVLKNDPPGYRVDRWTDGFIHCQKLPSDYLEKSIRIREFSNIDLRTLQPLDIVVTKIGRLSQRDIQDIETCIRQCNLQKADIEARAQLLLENYIGPEEEYLEKLMWVLQKYF
jgi:hypothetical protein